MKQYIVLSLCLGLLASCGSKSGDSDKKVLTLNEEQLGLTSHSECGRAEEVRGSNYVYRWIKAKEGDLQRFIIQNDVKKIQYDEASTSGTIKGEATYKFVPEGKKIVFRTTSKSLKLTFPQIPMGTIENVPSGRQYVIGILTYDDGSGYFDKFLCEVVQ